MDPPANRDDLIQQFCALTQASPTDAASTLASCNWDLEPAIQTWFASQDQDDSDSDGFEYGEADDDEDDKPRPIPTSTSNTQRGAGSSAGPTGTSAGRTPGSSSRGGTGGITGPTGSGASRSIRTLRDIGSNAEDEDDDDEKDPSYFAGGEKSGLAVQGSGPGRADQAIKGILDRARRNLPRPGGDDEPPRPTRFTGRGVTLGGDDAPSEVVVEPPRARAASRAERVRRTLHLWEDGFSVDSGDLYRYDDPANSQALDLINSGRAPVHLLNVVPGQEVDLEVDVKKETKYVRPKAEYKPFGGQGQRLGSPTPGASTPVPARAPAPAATATPKAPEAIIDESAPAISLQIRLGDGTRLQSRFNTTQTIGDVYDFVSRAQTGQRAYSLMTTFPTKELSDKGAVLGELPEFRRGGVVVQKWT